MLAGGVAHSVRPLPPPEGPGNSDHVHRGTYTTKADPTTVLDFSGPAEPAELCPSATLHALVSRRATRQERA
eukprot:8987484-Alexandrium_andersonii.AAC.1